MVIGLELGNTMSPMTMGIQGLCRNSKATGKRGPVLPVSYLTVHLATQSPPDSHSALKERSVSFGIYMHLVITPDNRNY